MSTKRWCVDEATTSSAKCIPRTAHPNILHWLSNELLVNIMQYIPLFERCFNVELCCCMFKAIVLESYRPETDLNITKDILASFYNAGGYSKIRRTRNTLAPKLPEDILKDCGLLLTFLKVIGSRIGKFVRALNIYEIEEMNLVNAHSSRLGDAFAAFDQVQRIYCEVLQHSLSTILCLPVSPNVTSVILQTPFWDWYENEMEVQRLITYLAALPNLKYAEVRAALLAPFVCAHIERVVPPEASLGFGQVDLPFPGGPHEHAQLTQLSSVDFALAPSNQMEEENHNIKFLEAMQEFCNLQTLRRLKLSKARTANSVVVKGLDKVFRDHTPDLESLSIFELKTDFSCLKHLSKLTTLSLKEVCMSPHELSTVGGTCRALTELNIYRLQNLSDAHLEAISQCFTMLQKFRLFNLNGLQQKNGNGLTKLFCLKELRHLILANLESREYFEISAFSIKSRSISNQSVEFVEAFVRSSHKKLWLSLCQPKMKWGSGLWRRMLKILHRRHWRDELGQKQKYQRLFEVCFPENFISTIKQGLGHDAQVYQSTGLYTFYSPNTKYLMDLNVLL